MSCVPFPKNWEEDPVLGVAQIHVNVSTTLYSSSSQFWGSGSKRVENTYTLLWLVWLCWLENCTVHQKVCGFNSQENKYLGWGFNTQVGVHSGGNQCFSLTLMSLSQSNKPIIEWREKRRYPYLKSCHTLSFPAPDGFQLPFLLLCSSLISYLLILYSSIMS